MPRPRKPDPTIPAHIAQDQIPRGVYWDGSGNGRWYTLEREPETGRNRYRQLATRSATLADLHALIERAVEPDAGTLLALFRTFHASPAFRALAPDTRRDYERSRRIIENRPTKLGTAFGGLQTARLTPAVLQRLVDSVAETQPTTGLHVLQYLRRVFRWGLNRGYVKHNPAAVLEAPKLKPRRRLPTQQAHIAVLQLAQTGGARLAHSAGSVAPYLWICMELAYLCHLRGIELIDLRESQATPTHLVALRRKGSKSTRFRWSPRLRAAWDAAIAYRNRIWSERRRPVPLRAEDRPVIVGQSGSPLRKSSLDTAWQRLITSAVDHGVINPEERFGLHDLKRKGITERIGTRADKQSASGHASANMMDVYDLSVPEADPAQNG